MILCVFCSILSFTMLSGLFLCYVLPFRPDVRSWFMRVSKRLDCAAWCLWYLKQYAEICKTVNINEQVMSYMMVRRINWDVLLIVLCSITFLCTLLTRRSDYFKIIRCSLKVSQHRHVYDCQCIVWCSTLKYCSSPNRKDRLCGLPSLLISGYPGSSPGRKAAGAWCWPFTSI
jgi:hypothetical protein